MEKRENNQKQGTVWLVGAGPGDTGLLTLRGRQLLQEADTVVYDHLAGAAVLGMIPPGTRCICVGKRAGRHSVPQEEINRILVEEAQAGRKVVRLKGGDPFLFGRGAEEMQQLKEAGIPCQVVPGVSSALAVPAYAGIPVTHRDWASSVHIITGHSKRDGLPAMNWSALAQLEGTLVFLMGVGHLEEICAQLQAHGKPGNTPAAILQEGTTSRQRTLIATLETLPAQARAAQIQAPAIVVVGEVCRLGRELAWVEQRPLHQLRVLVTRPQERASRLSGPLRRLGAEVVEFPAIATRPVADELLAPVLDQLDRYQWLAFTSPAGVEGFFGLLCRMRRDVRCLVGKKLAAIGPGTSEALAQRGLFADKMPEQYTAQALGEALVQAVQPGEAVLLPRAREGSPALTGALERAGIPYRDWPLYDTLPAGGEAAPVCRLLESGGIDLLTFTSGSCVRRFAQAMEGVDLSGCTAVCIGKQTAQEARALGMHCRIASRATMDAMVQAILEYAGNLPSHTR